MDPITPFHEPVLAEEVLEHLARPGVRLIVDCTIGLGGHARLFLERLSAAHLIGLDADPANLAAARNNLAPWEDRLRLLHANFTDIKSALTVAGGQRADAVLADLGWSSNQMADPARGMSFLLDGPLDMRIHPAIEQTAADLVNGLSEEELATLLWMQSQERHSRKISKRICEERRHGRITSTLQLARLVASALGEDPGHHRSKIHPATRTFQALRMAVNQETTALQTLLDALPGCLAPGGRAAVISFHSVEDRLVKNSFRGLAREGIYRIVTKKPIVAVESERLRNPRSRSAKLRIVEFAGSNLIDGQDVVH